MDMMEHAIEACEGISRIAQYHQKFNEAFCRAQPTCGSCTKWMCRPSCPRERGVMTGGPSSGASACDQFNGNPQFHADVAAFKALPWPK